MKRDYGVLAIDGKVLVEELGEHPDYLGQLKRTPGKPTVIHQTTIVSSIPTSSDKVQVPNQSDQPKAATVDIVVGSRPCSDPPLDVQVQAPSRIDHPAATSGATSGPWKEQRSLGQLDLLHFRLQTAPENEDTRHHHTEEDCP